MVTKLSYCFFQARDEPGVTHTEISRLDQELRTSDRHWEHARYSKIQGADCYKR